MLLKTENRPLNKGQQHCVQENETPEHFLITTANLHQIK